MESDGDGIFYSYSIFDSMPQLQAWADRIFIISTMPQKKIPLMQMPHPTVCLVAFREPSGPGWAGC